MEDTEATLGQNIRRIREAAGLSQAQVADAMVEAGVEGFYPQTVLKVEKGTRALKFVEGLELAAVLGVEPRDLYKTTPWAAALAELQAGLKLIERRRNRYFQAMYDLAVVQGQVRQVLGDESRWEGIVTPQELAVVRDRAFESPEQTFRAGVEWMNGVAGEVPSPLAHWQEGGDGQHQEA